jgi:peptidoglycan/xylan/chitin deacetylase (PgdA/CDA1 family)
VIPDWLLLSAALLTPPLPPPFRHPPPLTWAQAAACVPPAPVLAPVPPAVVSRAPGRDRRVALTFDACEASHTAGYDAAVIRILERQEVPATLFLGGRWMWSHPDETRALAAAVNRAGQPLFELGNHSYRHPHLTRVSAERLRGEVAATQAIEYALTGRQGHWLRAPYGEVDARVARVAGELGLRLAEFDVVTGDPDPHVTAAAILRAVTHRVRSGSVVIMHMNGRGRHTAAALPEVLAALRRRGYTFVTMSQLLQASAAP